MEKDISVKVSREGNITMTVPELANPLTPEEARLTAILLSGVTEDSKQLGKLWAEQDSILKPYNSHGRKISAVKSKVRDVDGALPEGVISDEAAR